MIRRHKLTAIEITALGIIGALVIGISLSTLKETRVKEYDMLFQAAQKTAEAYSIIKNARIEKKIFIDDIDDPAESGMIGVVSSSITTNVGDLESKQTSVNPNWAAVIIKYLKQAGVKPGDAVAISMTGSFPALNIAALIAVEEYGARPFWLISEGSSAWGANVPGLTWLQMENLLYSHRFLPRTAIAASLGGNNNTGGGMPSEGRDTLRRIIRQSKIPLVEVSPLDSSISVEFALLQKAMGNTKPALFINIGGGLASLGTSEVGAILKPGLNSPKLLLDIEDEPVQGYAALFLRQGIHVLNILDIIPLAKINSLPVAPAVTPPPGSGYLFSAPRYNVAVNIILLVVFVILIASVSLGFADYIFKNPRKEEMV